MNPQISTLEFFRTERLRQLLWLSFLGAFFISLRSLSIGHITTGLIFGFLSLSTLGFLRLNQFGHTKLSAQLFLWSAAICLILAIWEGEGIRDSNLLAFPGLLMIAAMITTRVHIYALLSFILGNLLAMKLFQDFNIYHSKLGPISWGLFADYSLVLSIVVLIVGVISNDLKKLFHTLQEESQRFLDSQAQIEHLNQHDALTGLPNRLLTQDRFHQTLAHIKRYPSKIGLLFLNLDHFKSINDAKGHQIGDLLLIELAERLKASLRETDTLCRHSGDEFIILLEGIQDTDRISTVALKILAEVAKPFEIGEHELNCTASIGITIAPGDGLDFNLLLQKADMALSKAKEFGRNNFHFFDEAMQSNVYEHMELLGDLRKAIVEKQFVLHYQPQVHLSTGNIMGCEALLRWQHPTKGLIPPLDFIPLAESSGLIVEIGSWVLFEACRQAKQWRDQGYGDIIMAVNISPIQCKRGRLDETVLHALEQSKLPPSCLELELTESMLIDDSKHLQDMLRRLKNLGVHFSIDDFGTGYSNLAYLKKFEMDTLKVDQSFVRKMDVDHQDKAIVRAILHMAQGLGLHTIAEGIEDETILHKLKEMGCEIGQGYYWSKPLSPAAMDEFFREY